MKHNVGGLDRVLRIVVGLVLIALAATGTVGWWGWIGVVPLLTGLFSVCPAYSLLGVNTCPMRKSE
ncbi:YgaP family membrane protein [Diaphorobacter sp.]|uniref:YgaP family membrane protein n=1 Tax=Diaphorobacter sp. TaxID=1934310 RepID=UPI003D10AF3C